MGIQELTVADFEQNSGLMSVPQITERNGIKVADKEFDSLDQFRGMIAKQYGKDPTVFERMQFMKNFSEIR